MLFISDTTLRGEEISICRITGVFTLRGVAGVDLMGCGVGGGLIGRYSMVEISTYTLEVVSSYVREERLEDLF